MNARKRMAQQGFTLVEILIVVVILGILAAIVIPQFTNASESARASSLQSQLQTIRSQLELFQVQHMGAYPDLVTNQWPEMTAASEPTSTYALGDGSGNDVGPYLQQAPTNAFAPAADTTGSGIGAATATNTAWAYDKATGEIKANVALTTAQAQALGLDTTNDVVTTDAGT